MTTGWLSNDPKIAALLRAADVEYDAAVAAAAGQKLGPEIAAIREAKARRLGKYDLARDMLDGSDQ